MLVCLRTCCVRLGWPVRGFDRRWSQKLIAVGLRRMTASELGPAVVAVVRRPAAVPVVVIACWVPRCGLAALASLGTFAVCVSPGACGVTYSCGPFPGPSPSLPRGGGGDK